MFHETKYEMLRNEGDTYPCLCTWTFNSKPTGTKDEFKSTPPQLLSVIFIGNTI